MSTTQPRSRLDRAQVIAAAIAHADECGLEATSMRKVAERLHVTPMALYKHVENRSELIDEMLDHVLALLPEPGDQEGWRPQVRARILACRSLLGRHPWMREAIETRTLATPQALGHMDALMAAMFDGGLSADLVHDAMHTLSTRMWGFTREAMPTPRVPDDPGEREQAIAEFTANYPAIMRMATLASHAGAGCDDDAEFAFALDLILAGVHQLHQGGWR
ncbi:TetR/AcrR family transcriptional regulator [Propioniciclava flava]|uniref:TetR/AcrR family transcriptional regulator n=1 Tax=Propioniciclava flava TaxID=2072026 RepID=UPI0019D67783|nr:TetR/AcrR family transcriptional regulator C-terminal domain-containing protein [Propioniciclava flava]